MQAIVRARRRQHSVLPREREVWWRVGGKAASSSSIKTHCGLSQERSRSTLLTLDRNGQHAFSQLTPSEGAKLSLYSKQLLCLSHCPCVAGICFNVLLCKVLCSVLSIKAMHCKTRFYSLGITSSHCITKSDILCEKK